MNTKCLTMIIITAALVAVTICLYRPTTSNQVQPPTQKKLSYPTDKLPPVLLPEVVSDQQGQKTNGTESSNRALLDTIANGMRQIENEDVKSRSLRAKAGNAAMEMFLKTWNPIGKLPTDLKAVFGKPERETDDSLLYSFDTGYSAWNYQFAVRNGKVAELTRPLSE